MKKELKIPKFKNEDEEREYWSKIDLSDYVEADDFEKVVFQSEKEFAAGKGKKLRSLRDLQ